MLTDNPRHQLSDHQNRVQLVSRLGFEMRAYQHSSGWQIVPLEILNRYFNSSNGLLDLFRLLEVDKDQTIDASIVATVLREHGIYARQSAHSITAFQELITMITPSSRLMGSSSSTRQASLNEYLTILRNLRLAAIIRDSRLDYPDTRMFLHECDEDVLTRQCPMKNPVAFLYTPYSEFFLNRNVTEVTGGSKHPVKLLHVHEASNTVILGLTVKYRLDTRFVAEVFQRRRTNATKRRTGTHDMRYLLTANAAVASSMNNNNLAPASSPLGSTPMLPASVHAPSIDNPMWFTMVVPILRLGKHSLDTLRKYQEWRESLSGDVNGMGEEFLDGAPGVEILVEHCDLVMFVSAIAGGTTVVSFGSDSVVLTKLSTEPIIGAGESAISRWIRRINSILAGIFSAKVSTNQTADGRFNSGTGILLSDRGLDTDPWSMFRKALDEIKDLDSPIRAGDARAFLLKVLRDITEYYLLIAQAYKAYLQILKRRTDKEKHNLDSKEVKRLKESLTQLVQLNQVIEPVAAMVDTFSSREQLSLDAQLYVSDIKANVSRFLRDATILRQQADSIAEKYENYVNHRMLVITTMLTAYVAMFSLPHILISIYAVAIGLPASASRGGYVGGLMGLLPY